MGKRIAKRLGKGNEFKCFDSNLYLGKYNGYDISIRYDYASLIYNIHFNVKGKENIDALNKKLMEYDEFAVARYREPNLTITNSCDSIRFMPDKANKIMDIVCEYLSENKYDNLCKRCNKHKNTNLVKVDDNITFYCDNCYNDTIKFYEKELEEKKNINENVFAGILGSLLGCLPGFVLWLILTYLMINPSVTALIIMLGSAYGYKWSAKSMKLPGLFCSLIIGFGFVIFANELSNAYTLYNEYINQFNINLFDAYKALPYYLNTSNTIRTIYNQNLFLAIMFGVFGGLSSFGVHRSYIASNKISKVEV